MLNILFFISILLILYAYFLYPITLLVLIYFKKKEVKKKPYFPNVTIIISAHNEEKRIHEKLRNTLQIEYPQKKLEIIVVSDGSTDRTNEIVKVYNKSGIKLLEISEHLGKENAQKEAIKRARGDVLVFSDVATVQEKKSLKEIVFNFADESIGCVSSEDHIIGKDGKLSGEGLYVKYEMWLRRLESKANSLVGLSGSFFAARKEVCKDFSGKMQSDFRTLLNSIKMSLRGICDQKVVGYYLDVLNEKREFERKVRTVLRGITVFFNHLEFLNFIKYGLFSYQFFCHKLLRWLVPFFLIILFISNLLLSKESFLFSIVFFCQFCFYSLSIFGKTRRKGYLNKFLKVPTYFLTVNLSIIVAWWRYLLGHRITLWNPSER